MASATSKNTRNSRFVLSAHRHFQGVRCVDSCTRSRRGLLSRVLVSLLHVLYLFDDCAHSSLVPGHSLLTHCPGEARKRKDVRTSLSIALNDAHRGSTFHRANNARDLAANSLNKAHQELSFKKNSRKKCFFCADLWSAKVWQLIKAGYEFFLVSLT